MRVRANTREISRSELIDNRELMSLLSFKCSLILSVVLASSVAELTNELATLRLMASSATHIASEFGSIRQGSFISVSDFRKSFPLQTLLNSRPDLFLTPEGSDPIDQLSQDLRVSRREAVDNFIAYNYHKIETALLKILASTNDLVIASVIIDPFGASDKDFVRPITDLIIDYLRVRSRRCLLDFLPDVFANPAVYDTHFSPAPGFHVTPREDEGYTIVTPNALFLESSAGLAVWAASQRRNGLISVRNNKEQVLVDSRSNCAVSLPRALRYQFDANLPGWLFACDAIARECFIWRKDSVEPLVIVDRYIKLETLADMSRVLLKGERCVYSIPVDPDAPFIATMLEEWTEEMLLEADISSGSYINLADGSIVLLTAGTFIDQALWEDVTTSISREAGIHPVALGLDSGTHLQSAPSVSTFLTMMSYGSYAKARVLAIGICRRFKLRNRRDFEFFILAVIDGYRPAGLDLLIPARDSPSGRLEGILRSVYLRLIVYVHWLARSLRSNKRENMIILMVGFIIGEALSIVASNYVRRY